MANFAAVTRAAIAAVLLGAAGFGSVATGASLPAALAAPGDRPTDARGFVGTSARCDGPMKTAALGRTPLSLIVICSNPRGGFEYRGMRIRDRAPLRLPATELANGCFGVRGDGVDYTVSPNKLLLTAGMRIVRDETMLQFEDRRVPESAPISKTSGGG
jgi:hypothetical protein